MIEIEIPKDIRQYEAKLIASFTTRQTICGSIAAIIGVGTFFLFDFIPQDIRIFIVLVLVSPLLLCGWIKPYGMHFEKFIQSTIVTNVLAPTNRKYITKNMYDDIDMDAGKNKNKDKNKNKQKAPKSKEYIAYE